MDDADVCVCIRAFGQSDSIIISLLMVEMCGDYEVPTLTWTTVERPVDMNTPKS